MFEVTYKPNLIILFFGFDKIAKRKVQLIFLTVLNNLWEFVSKPASRLDIFLKLWQWTFFHCALLWGSEEKLNAPLPMTPHSSAATFVRTTEIGRTLLMLYRNCTRKGSNARDRMAVDRLASLLLSLGPGICFHCQGGEPGRAWLGQMVRGVWERSRKPCDRAEEWEVEESNHPFNDHLTQWSPYPAFCRRLSQLLALDGNFGLPLFTDPAARYLTSRQKYLEEVEERVTNKNGMYF